MKNFWKIVNKIINEADIVIEVLDARFIEETLNKEIDGKLRIRDKHIIYVLNKSDLVKEKFENISINLTNYVFVSAINNLGTTQLRRKIKEITLQIREKDPKKEIIIGVLGYPNTGKSSLINVLKQKKAVRTSPVAGHTIGIQKIRLGEKLYILDTPGVFPELEKGEQKDELQESLMNVKDPSKIKDPESVAVVIIDKIKAKNPKIIEDLYKIKLRETAEETLEAIAKKHNWIQKGAKPNIDLVSRKIITDWQRGKIIF